MKKQIIYQIDETEAQFIKNCLDYVFHRVAKHKKKIPFIKLRELNRLRKQLDAKR